MELCPLGINGGEYPHWPIAKICDLAVEVKARFVELSVARIAETGAEDVRRELSARGLAVHVDGDTSELAAAFSAAIKLDSGLIIAFDDAVERPDMSRMECLDRLKKTAGDLLEQPGHENVQVAMENSVIGLTRHPDDLLAIVAAVGHPRFGVNYDPGNYYNAGIEGFPYAYELVRSHVFHIHAKDSTRWIPRVHGSQRRVLHRGGGNVVCVPLGTGAVNWAGLADRLRADGYRGPVSLEPHNLPHEMAPRMAEDSAYLRRIGLVG
jgi:sugar phosphate isomerase/epimerase